MSILDEIFANKRQEVSYARENLSPSALETAVKELPPPLSLSAAIKAGFSQSPRLVAEVKFRSPSKGVLRPDFDPLGLAHIYARNGASAISVLTDEKYFGGSLKNLRDIANLGLGLPLLRKDFMFDRYQLLEARLAGASAVLLIVAMLESVQLADLLAATHDLGMEALVEVHNRQEVAQAVEVGARMIGINNRDLHTFTVSLETSLQLRPSIPAGVVVVAESGIHSPQEVARLGAAGVDAILVGESLVTAPDVISKVRELSGLQDL